MTPLKRNHTRILSPRERAIVDGLVAGHRMVDLARAESLSVKTIATYRQRALRKLGLATNADLVRWAAEQKAGQA